MDFSKPGAFALLCRCGKAANACDHPDVANGTRIVLPPSSEPLAYNLTIALRLEDHAFDGDVTIDVEVRESGLRELTLHAKELTFTSATFGAELATDIKVDTEKTTVTFSFANALPRGTSKLNVVYSGVLNNQMCGFYRSTYKDVKGEDKLMASTQFESIDARRCFPCWDEPARKSQFTCSLRVPVHMTALSNMPESQSLNHNDGTKTARPATLAPWPPTRHELGPSPRTRYPSPPPASADAGVVHGDAAHVHLPPRLRRGRVRPRLRHDQARRRHPRVLPARQAAPGQLRVAVRGGRARPVRRHLPWPSP